MKVSKHFSREEFACNCKCGFSAVDFELLNALEDIREHFNKPVTISSACRCDSHNTNIGGSKDSMHKKGIACDIAVQDINSKEVQEYLLNKYTDSKGIGSYKNFTHFDVRDYKARLVV